MEITTSLLLETESDFLHVTGLRAGQWHPLLDANQGGTFWLRALPLKIRGDWRQVGSIGVDSGAITVSSGGVRHRFDLPPGDGVYAVWVKSLEGEPVTEIMIWDQPASPEKQ